MRTKMDVTNITIKGLDIDIGTGYRTRSLTVVSRTVYACIYKHLFIYSFRTINVVKLRGLDGVSKFD